ncbi:ABC transporter substrate-binding protein [Bordetella tumbae]|uniref:Bug family tripartite tricarboxylate transporter substrate binding protein n=1 Tax=Bordetella tumbae TaxID=1649139 RepID=UPI0039EE1634
MIKNVRRLAMVCALAGAAQANAAWPEHPITIIVPAAPGGTTDIVARLVGEKLSTALKQQVVIENRAGAGGIIGAQLVARAKNDGYTFLMGNIGPNAINYSLYKALPYKPTDFTPVTQVIMVPNILVVNAKSPYKTAADLIAAAKKEPLTVGSSGTGQSPHMSAEMFKQRTGIEATHVPYKGAGPAVAALLGSQFTFMIDNLPSSLGSIQDGKFRALAVTSAKRSPVLPDVPTMEEAGVKDMVVTAWFGLFAPAGTDMNIVNQLQQATNKIIHDGPIAERFRALGGEPGGDTPKDYAAFVERERTQWKDIVQKAGLKQE